MYCSKCGKAITDDAVYCQFCGARTAGLAGTTTNDSNGEGVYTAEVIDDGTKSNSEQLSMFGYFAKCLKKYAVFSGRARRREFWYFYLVNVLIGLVIWFIFGITGIGNDGISVLCSICELVFFLPSLAVHVRRLHDTNRSGWCVLIGIVPIIGWIILLILLCTDSQPGANKYGPNPKGQN